MKRMLILSVLVVLGVLMIYGCKHGPRIVLEEYEEEQARKGGCIDSTDYVFVEETEHCLRTRGVVHGQELLCTIANASTNDIVYIKPEFGFHYSILYRNAAGKIVTFHSPCLVGFNGIREIGILGRQDPRYFSLNYNHAVQFKIDLPVDCVVLMAVSVDFKYMQFSELLECKSLSEFAERYYLGHSHGSLRIRLVSKDARNVQAD